MPPELVAALVLALSAAAAFLRSEVELRRQRSQLHDVARKVGADRRRADDADQAHDERPTNAPRA